MATTESITPEAPAVTTASTTTATTATTPPEGGLIGAVLPFVFIFVVFYFIMIRPQQKRLKEHQALVAAVRRGDKVITSGGIVGKVAKVDTEDKIIHVEIADEVIVKVVASSVTSVESAEKPVNDNGKAKDKKKK